MNNVNWLHGDVKTFRKQKALAQQLESRPKNIGTHINNMAKVNMHRAFNVWDAIDNYSDNEATQRAIELREAIHRRNNKALANNINARSTIPLTKAERKSKESNNET